MALVLFTQSKRYDTCYGSGIRFSFYNWKDVVEQPYEVTAKIPIKPVPESELGVSTIEILKRKPAVIPSKGKAKKLPRRKRTIPITASLSQVRSEK